MEQKLRVKTGDILICKASTIPIIQHFGVVVVEDTTICVYHCTPFRNVACDPIMKFLEEHELIRIRPTNATKASIYENYKRLRGRKYDLNSFNCTHFAEYLTG